VFLQSDAVGTIGSDGPLWGRDHKVVASQSELIAAQADRPIPGLG